MVRYPSESGSKLSYSGATKNEFDDRTIAE